MILSYLGNRRAEFLKTPCSSPASFDGIALLLRTNNPVPSCAMLHFRHDSMTVLHHREPAGISFIQVVVFPSMGQRQPVMEGGG